MRLQTRKIILDDSRWSIVDLDDEEMPQIEITFHGPLIQLSKEAKQKIIFELAKSAVAEYDAGHFAEPGSIIIPKTKELPNA